MHIIQAPLFDFEAFIADKSNNHLTLVLEALPAEKLLAALDKEHWTGKNLIKLLSSVGDKQIAYSSPNFCRVVFQHCTFFAEC